MKCLEEAEMTKIIENSYRFVQIAFAEEMSSICVELGLDWEAVRAAANTKWNIEIPEARDGIKGCLAKDARYLGRLADRSENQLITGAISTDAEYQPEEGVHSSEHA